MTEDEKDAVRQLHADRGVSDYVLGSTHSDQELLSLAERLTTAPVDLNHLTPLERVTVWSATLWSGNPDPAPELFLREDWSQFVTEIRSKLTASNEAFEGFEEAANRGRRIAKDAKT